MARAHGDANSHSRCCEHPFISSIQMRWHSEEHSPSYLVASALSQDMPAFKDSSDVIEFRTLYRQLKDQCEERPANIPQLCENSESIRKLSIQLHWSGFFMRYSERLQPELYTSPVDPDFIREWREYEMFYEPIVNKISEEELLRELDISEENLSSKTDRVPARDQLWEDADRDAIELAHVVNRAMEFAQVQVHEGEYPDEVPEIVSDGVAGWESLQAHAGFDLRGVLRRRKLVPFVLVPRQVAARGERTNRMVKNLQQAHGAFVFGAPYAALTLMRAILEAVLRDHYGAEGAGLGEKIDSVHQELLPAEARRARLHRLRRTANSILHEPQSGIQSHMRIDEKRPELMSMDEKGLEKEIVSLLLVLRALIEGRGRSDVM